jgi:TolB-like protein/Flp pilus assembly protein TadD
VNVRPAQAKIQAVREKTDVTTRTRWAKPVWIGAAFAVAVLTVTVVLLLRGREQSATVAPVRAPPSIAVLPFIDMSTEQDQEHFAEGLSEEILNLLAHSENLKVIARTSSFSFQGQNADVQTIAQRLSVTHVLEGSVRRAGERIRITAQLIDGATSAHVWSETYDRDVKDVFGVQREIASKVADALQVTLRSDDGPRRAETSSPQAYESYLHGRHLFQRRSGSDLVRAKGYFEQAVQIDPAYARAWAALAGVYFVAQYEDLKLPDALAKWGVAAQRAVALAPDLAEANVRAAQYYRAVGDWDSTGKLLARAFAVDPSDPLVIGFEMERAILEGRMDDAVAVQRRIIAIDPLSAIHRANLGAQLIMAGRLDEARAELERALELGPAGGFARENIAYVLILQRRTDEALKVIQPLPAGYAREQSLALAHFARGDVAEGDAALSRLLALGEAPGAGWEVASAIAEVHALKSDPDQAFKWLDLTRSRLASTGLPMPDRELMRNLRMSPFLKALHADPRWAKLLASLDAQ